MVARVAGRGGHRYRTARAYVLAASDTCWICGHPGSRQIDHDPALVVLLEMGVDPDQPPVHEAGPRHRQPLPHLSAPLQPGARHRTAAGPTVTTNDLQDPGGRETAGHRPVGDRELPMGHLDRAASE